MLEDIRCGMAAERLDRYVAFFRVPAELFLDTAVGAYSPDFSCQILRSRHDARAVSPFDCGRGVANLELLNRQNDEVNLNNLLGLLGGWPGAIVAQQVLRHKSNKAAFRASFWLTVLANVAGFIVLSSPIRTLLPV